MKLSQAAWFLLARIGLTVLAGALAGWLLGHVFAGVAVALALALGWQLLNLYRLEQWLRDRGGRNPPDAPGVWGEVVSQVVRLHRRKRFHKQRLLDVFRELRRSTAAMPDGVVSPEPRLGDQLVQSHGRAAAGAQAPQGHPDARYQPGARPGLRPVPGVGRVLRTADRSRAVPTRARTWHSRSCPTAATST